MKKSTKAKTKRSTAKKPATRAATKSSRRSPLKTKQRRKQSAATSRKRVANDQASSVAAVATSEHERTQSFSPLFWPAFPLAMMNMWLRTGEAARK
jgi:hypothetical protein